MIDREQGPFLAFLTALRGCPGARLPSPSHVRVRPPADQCADHADRAAADARAGVLHGHNSATASPGIQGLPGGPGQPAPAPCAQAQARPQDI